MSLSCRRDFLAALAAVGCPGLAGCAGGVGGGSAVTPQSTGDCSVSERPAPTEAAAPPREYPETPAELTTETVGAFVAAFERTFQYNRALAADPQKVGRLNELTVRVDDPTVESAESDDSAETTFTVSVSGTRDYRIATPESTETPTPSVTPLPMGRAPFSASYVVTPRAVRREGTVVHCW